MLTAFSPPWTPEDEARLRALAAAGRSIATIAERLKRPAQAVRYRARKLNILLRREGRAEAEADSQMNDETNLPMAGLDLDTIIRLRWELRDIKAKRLKMSPISSEDLRTLLEMGLVEMRDEVPVLTSEGERALDWS
jgi:hypothetical protein